MIKGIRSGKRFGHPLLDWLFSLQANKSMKVHCHANHWFYVDFFSLENSRRVDLRPLCRPTSHGHWRHFPLDVRSFLNQSTWERQPVAKAKLFLFRMNSDFESSSEAVNCRCPQFSAALFLPPVVKAWLKLISASLFLSPGIWFCYRFLACFLTFTFLCSLYQDMLRRILQSQVHNLPFKN